MLIYEALDYNFLTSNFQFPWGGGGGGGGGGARTCKSTFSVQPFTCEPSSRRLDIKIIYSSSCRTPICLVGSDMMHYYQ